MSDNDVKAYLSKLTELLDSRFDDLHKKYESQSDKIEWLKTNYALHTGIEEHRLKAYENALEALRKGQKENKEHFDAGVENLKKELSANLTGCYKTVKEELKDEYLKQAQVESMIELKFRKMLVWFASLVSTIAVLANQAIEYIHNHH